MDRQADSTGATQANTWYRPFLLILLFASIYLTYLILRPYLNSIIFAVIISSLLYPLQVRLEALYGGRKNLAAATVIVLVVFLFLLPSILFLSAVIKQGLVSITQLNDWVRAGNLQTLLNHHLITEWGTWLHEHFKFINWGEFKLQQTLLQFGKNFGQLILARGGALLSDAATLIMHFFVMIFVCFYVVRDGAELISQIKYLSPLRASQEDRIIEKIRAVARSAILGSFATAVCQGLVGGIGFYLVGIPALFWGTVMAFCSFIPVVGTALIWLPAAGYLLLLGKWKAAAFLVAWSAVLVGSIDNFLRPVFMKGQAEMSPFYILLAILGGVQFFGLAGILYGPLILAFAKVMLFIYQVEYHDLLAEHRKPAAAPEEAATDGEPS